MPRKYFQFRLRTLLLAMSAAIVVTCWLVDEGRRAEDQRVATRNLTRMGVSVAYRSDLDLERKSLWRPPRRLRSNPSVNRTSWYDRMIGDLFDRVEMVDVAVQRRNLDRVLTNYQKLRGVRILSVRGPRVTESALRTLTQGRRLRELYLNSARPSGASIAEILDDSDTLTHLSMRYCRLSQTGLDRVTRHSPLQELGFHSCIIPSGTIDFLELQQLKALGILSHESANTNLKIKSLPSTLETLALVGVGVEDEHLHAGLLPVGLRSLDLSGSRITDASISDLMKLEQLRQLNLTSTGLTSDGLRRLRNLRTLYSLSIDGILVDDVTVEHIRQFPALRALWVWHPFEGTLTNRNEGRIDLRSELPQLQIYHRQHSRPNRRISG